MEALEAGLATLLSTGTAPDIMGPAESVRSSAVCAYIYFQRLCFSSHYPSITFFAANKPPRPSTLTKRPSLAVNMFLALLFALLALLAALSIFLQM